MPNHTPSSVYLRVFRYGSWVAISIVFPSSLRERGSERAGSVLGLGALIHRNIFWNYEGPSSSYMTILLSQLNAIFKIDLFRGGADVFLGMIDDDARSAELKCGLQQLLYPLLEFTLMMHRRRSRWPSFALPYRISFAKYPRVILFNQSNGISLVRAFFSGVDSYLSYVVIGSVEVTNESFGEGASIAMIPIEFQLHEAKTVSLVEGRVGNYIEVY